jgi:hypothetical protein
MVGEDPTRLRNITLIDAARYSSTVMSMLLLVPTSGHGLTVGRSIIPVLLWHVMTPPNLVSNFDR